MDYTSYVHTLNRDVKLIMRSLQPTPPGGGASGSENQTTAVRIEVCGANDKSGPRML